jgi:hypothetical protein
MSDRRGVVLALLLAGIALAAEPDALALLQRAERVRAAFREGVVTIRVTLSGADARGPSPVTARFEVAVKGRRSRVKFLEPGDAGKFIVSSESDSWLLLPTARNPIRIPASYRVRGGLSVAEISQLDFVGDYSAVLEREDDFGGRRCAVFRLIAKKGARVPYPAARVWVDEKEALYRKAVFLLPSGRTAKEVTFDAYRASGGILVLDRMTINDALRPGTTVVEFLDFDRRPVPDAWLDPRTARRG